MDFEKILSKIPDYKCFLTVDEMDENSKALAEEYPDKVKVFHAGNSRKGHPIYCLKIGNGSKNALMFGCPHPNEPMGAMTLEFFSRAIAEDDELREELDYTWYIIKSIDVDGTMLNEKWFKGPFTLYNYTRNFFRPVAYEQVEWTFPVEYKNYVFNNPIPETEILMKLINETKPSFMYSLHNAGFGGAYWYLSHDLKEIYDDLMATARKVNVPLHLGEPEVPYGEKFAPAIFKLIGFEDDYDYLEKYSKIPPEKLLNSGQSSDGYARTKCDCVCLVTELPYFYEARIESDKKMDFTRREAALEKLEFMEDTKKTVEKYYTQVCEYMSSDNPFSKNIEQSIEYSKGQNETERNYIENNEEYDELCKESEALDNLDIPKFYKLIYLGLLLRSVEYELMKDNVEGEKRAKLQDVFNSVDEELKEASQVAEDALDYNVIPIRKLVRIQLESGLLVASHIN